MIVEKRFLGRVFDEKTHTYSFKDGSGVIPVEMLYGIDERAETGNALSELFLCQDRLKKKALE